MKEKLKVLLIGASGYLGKSLYLALDAEDKINVTGTYCKNAMIGFQRCNVLELGDIDKILKQNYDVIIWSVMNQLEEDLISETGLKHLVSSISKKTRLIYISTTIGVGKNQVEEVLPKKRDKNEYLHSYVNGKIMGEMIVREHENSIIIRPGSIYGFGENHCYDSRMTVLSKLFENNELFPRTNNFYASFVHIDDLISSVIELIGSNFVGTINIAAAVPVSHYDFNIYLAHMINIDDCFIIPESLDEDSYHTLSAERRNNVLETVIREIQK